METEEKNQRACKSPETDLFLQWGNRKRVRCVRFRDPDFSDPSKNGKLRRKISSRFLTLSQKQTSSPQPPTRLTRNSETATLQSENRKSSASGLPEKEERFYTTRGSVVGLEEIGKDPADGVVGGVGDEKRGRCLAKAVYCFVKQRERGGFYGYESV